MAQPKALMNIAPRPAQVFVRGEGHYLWDSDGRRYLDMIQGWAVNCLGHSPPVITEALARQADQLITPSPAFFNQPSIELANALTAASCFDQVFFASSGAEANEGAIKLARKFGALHRGGAYEIITFQGGFHGRTLATMSASGKPAFAKLYEPKVSGFQKAVLNDIDSVTRLLDEQTVAVMLEPVQGEAGVVVADDDFLRALREITREAGVLLIVDEIQTGVGRCGKLFGYQHTDIRPDIMTLGKGIGGGVPLAALLATDAVSCFEYGDQGGTYCGNPLMTAVGSAVLKTVNTLEFLNQVERMGAALTAQLTDLSKRFGLGSVRGRGLLLALDTGAIDSTTIADRAMDEGLLVNAPRPDTLRFMPALTLGEDQIEEAVSGLSAALNSL